MTVGGRLVFSQTRARVPWSQRYRTSRAIFGQAFHLLRRERDLWIFPITSTLFFGAWTALAILAMYRLGLNDWSATIAPGWADPAVEAPVIAGFLLLPAFFPLGLVMSLNQLALVYAILERSEGRRCTKRQAWSRAMSRLGPLVRFNLVGLLVAGLFQTVGILLNKLRVVPYLGQVFQTLGMFGWAAATYFVFPILALEDERTALGAVRRSTSIARQHWGKSVGGIITIGLAVLVPLLALMLVWYLALFGALASWSPGGGIEPFLTFLAVSGIVFGVLFLAVMALQWGAHAAYQAVLYRYATTGRISEPFTTATLVDAWTPYRQP